MPDPFLQAPPGSRERRSSNAPRAFVGCAMALLALLFLVLFAISRTVPIPSF